MNLHRIKIFPMKTSSWTKYPGHHPDSEQTDIPPTCITASGKWITRGFRKIRDIWSSYTLRTKMTFPLQKKNPKLPPIGRNPHIFSYFYMRF